METPMSHSHVINCFLAKTNINIFADNCGSTLSSILEGTIRTHNPNNDKNSNPY